MAVRNLEPNPLRRLIVRLYEEHTDPETGELDGNAVIRHAAAHVVRDPAKYTDVFRMVRREYDAVDAQKTETRSDGQGSFYDDGGYFVLGDKRRVLQEKARDHHLLDYMAIKTDA